MWHTTEIFTFVFAALRFRQNQIQQRKSTLLHHQPARASAQRQHVQDRRDGGAQMQPREEKAVEGISILNS